MSEMVAETVGISRVHLHRKLKETDQPVHSRLDTQSPAKTSSNPVG